MMKHKLTLLMPLLTLLFSCSSSGSTSSGSGATFSVTEAANQVSQAAKKYNDSITSETLLENVVKLDSSIDTAGQCTYSHFFLLLKEAFSSASFPAKTGARAMEAFSNDPDTAYSTYEESSPYTTAFRFVSDAGLVNASEFGTDFDSKAVITDAEAWTLLDRFHWYYATSAVDDFYSYSNYDQRIANCVDEGKGVLDTVNVSNVIPRSGIVDWAKKELVNDPDSKHFNDLYVASTDDDSGAAALRDYLQPILDSENVVTLVNAMIDLHNAYGYSPLYSTLNWGFLWFGNESFYLPTSTVFSCDDTVDESAKGGSQYNSNLEKFTPIFSSILGSETLGQSYAEAYADFRHLYVLKYKENSSHEDGLWAVDNDLILGETGLSFRKVLTDIGYPEDHRWVVENKRQAFSFYDLFTNENLPALKGYCLYQTALSYIALLPEEEHINAWALGSQKEGKRSDDSTYYHKYILPYFANDLANHYAKTDEYAEDVALVKDLYDQLRTTLASKAKSSSWLSESGAALLNQKADNMKYLIGNSSDQKALNELDQIEYGSISDTNFMNCITLYHKTLWNNNLERVANPPADDFYHDALSNAPFTPNAFYYPNRNGILVTMGYLVANGRPSEMTKEKFYSTFGWVVGHEIGHGFDSNGFKYDHLGNYNENWMSEEDKAALTNFIGKFQSYFDGYEGYIGFSTTGSVVLNEALADNIGLSICLSVGKNNGLSIKDFFLTGARVFGGYVSRSSFLLGRYEDDSHPFGRCRVNKGFSCFNEFHDAFATKEGDHMYVAEEERLVLY